ncbi:tetratricopeptide repeat protein [Ruminobacter amylophilus]|nr:tetratricopeptide repeat protein [Ruminobacter amylophilus]
MKLIFFLLVMVFPISTYAEGLLDCNKYMAEKKYTEAYSVCKQSCYDNYASSSCVSLGELYANGDGIKQSYENARKSFEKACLFGDFNGCQFLSYMYIRGDGVNKNENLASIYSDHACSLGKGEACYELASIYASSEYHKKYDKELMLLFIKKALQRGCDLKHQKSCDTLKKVYQ